MTQAAEEMSADDVLRQIHELERGLGTRLSRIGAHVCLRPGDRVADVGAGCGRYVAAFEQAGYEVVGVEPHLPAHQTARDVGRTLGLQMRMVEGVAEALPLPDESFQLVHCMSVMEHVDDPASCFREAFRVLRRGGAFFLHTTNSRSPRQAEIGRFPAFGWYPRPVQRRIMLWARDHRPGLIGYTSRPGMHWYNPRIVGRLARDAGFARTVDRWALKREDEVGGTQRQALRLLKRSGAARFVADLLVTDAAWLCLKD